jgi:hypothetical protein
MILGSDKGHVSPLSFLNRLKKVQRQRRRRRRRILMIL